MAFKQRTYTEVPHDENVSPQLREFLASLLSQVNALSGKGNPTSGAGIAALSVNTINPSTQQITSVGNRPASVTTEIGFVATAGTPATITFYWDGSNNSGVFKIGRDDGSTFGPNPAGSPFVVSGLTNGAKYFFYPYFDELISKIVFPSVPGVAVGSPPVAFTSPNFKAAQQQILSGHIALAGALSSSGITITNSGSQSGNAGTGGGGGQSGNNRGNLV